MNAKPDIVKKGAVYVTDSRKGRLTIRLRKDVNLSEDGFFDAEIIDGNVSYAAKGNQLAQKVLGQGTPGDVVTFRTTLTHFVRRCPELERKRRAGNGKVPSNG